MNTDKDRITKLEESARAALDFMSKYKNKSAPKPLAEDSTKPTDINDLITSIINEDGNAEDVELENQDDSTPETSTTSGEELTEETGESTEETGDTLESVVEPDPKEPVAETVVKSENDANPKDELADEDSNANDEETDLHVAESESIAFSDHEAEVFNMLMREIKESDEVDDGDPIVQENDTDEPDVDFDLEESFINIMDDDDIDDNEEFDLDLDLNFNLDN